MLFGDDNAKANKEGAQEAASGKGYSEPWPRIGESKSSYQARCDSKRAGYINTAAQRDGSEGRFLRSVPTHLFGESYEQWECNDRVYKEGWKSGARNPKQRGKGKTKAGCPSTGSYGGGGALPSGTGIGVVALLGIVAILVSFASKTSHGPPVAPSEDSGRPVASHRYKSSVYAGWQSFTVALVSASQSEGKTFLTVTLTNESKVAGRALLGNGIPRRADSVWRYTPLPFLRDQGGNEYLALRPLVRGDAARNVFDPKGRFNGVASTHVALQPGESVSAILTFPPVPIGSLVQLFIPNASIETPPIVVRAGPGPVRHDATDEDKIRRPGQAARISISSAGMAKSRTLTGQPVDVQDFFPLEDKTGNDRNGLVFFARYSGAVPEKTKFNVRFSHAGVETRDYLTRCEVPPQPYGSGVLTCRTVRDHMRGNPGLWTATLYADEVKVIAVHFTVEKWVSPLRGELRATASARSQGVP
ncbi:MAG: hypothetical protein IV094_01150 [Vitreoscilla sp.]|nr:hypothetical protein [Vitreoscilla sp.]